MTKRTVLLCVPALVAGALVGLATAASASPPTTATKVPVTANSNSTGIDAHLHAASSISGVIRIAGTTTPLNAAVDAYLGGHFVASTVTNPSTGAYTIDGLFAKSYDVCVGPFGVFSSSPTGFLGRCYKTAAFNGATVPAAATEVTLTAGQHKTGIGFSLPRAAAISGKATNTSGTGLGDVFVNLKNFSTGATYFAFTTSTGAYAAKSLPASAKGYGVCFNPSGVISGTGFLPRCFKNKSYNGSTVPSTASVVSVALGHTHGGVTQALPRGGAISGTVTDASNGHPLAFENIVAFNSSGKIIGGSSTNSTGKYVVRGLNNSSTDRVCAAPKSASPTVTFHGKCWKGISWNGGSLPGGTKAVTVNTGATHTGINFALSKTVRVLGSIAGTVTELAGGTALQLAEVDLFNSTGHVIDSTATDSSGHYKFSHLAANSTGYAVCASAGSGTFSATTTTPDTGWAPRCHTDVAWNGLGLPGTANKLPLSTGQNRTGINVALHVGGEISGTVNTSGVKTTTISGATVYLFTATGHLMNTTGSSFDGTYSFKGVAPSATGYLVCFDDRLSFGTPAYLPQCWQNVGWNGTL